MFSVNSEFEPEFVINSGACAPESVTRAANSQLHETLRAPAKCQLDSLLARVSTVHFCAEDVVIKNVIYLNTFAWQE